MIAPASAEDNAAASIWPPAWTEAAAEARANQPEWSSPLVTTTPLLEQRLRFDVDAQHAQNGSGTMVVDGGKGLDLIVSGSNEVQIAAPPYEIRSSRTGKGRIEGYGDWTFLRVKQRLAASPSGEGDYIVTAWLQVLAPSGLQRLTSNSWEFSPTLGFGKGWGKFDMQGTIGAVLPASHTRTLGHQIQSSVALQYRLFRVVTPEIEFNATSWTDGARAGLNQVFFTPGIVVGRLTLAGTLKLTVGAGYQIALAPHYRAAPLTPAYDHALVFSTRINF